MNAHEAGHTFDNIFTVSEVDKLVSLVLAFEKAIATKEMK